VLRGKEAVIHSFYELLDAGVTDRDLISILYYNICVIFSYL
jgi:hypothetical protein